MKLSILLSLSCMTDSSYICMQVVSAFSPCLCKRNSKFLILHTTCALSPSSSSSSSSEDRIVINTDKNSLATTTTARSNNKPSQSATVNSVTLQFNNRLNRMSKNFDGTTAIKVEALLLDAVRKYQLAKEAADNQDNHDDDDDSNQKNAQKKTTTTTTTMMNQQLTTNMITPNTISFTNAITAWARCTRKDSPNRAQALLDQMHMLYETHGWEHVKPNKITYNSVITAWARSRENDGGASARCAEALLHKMYDLYNDERFDYDEDMKPDARSWNAVINAVARSRDKDCADRAKHLLDEMGRLYNEGQSELLPDALTFGAIINAYANSFEEGASDKASQLLLHMESLYQLGFDNAKPTTFVYNACMNALAKDPMTTTLLGDGNELGNSRAEQAEQLLNSMEKRYEEERDYSVMPDCISYSTVINAYANSNTEESGIRADAILRRMTHRFLMGDSKCRPNAVAYTAAIKANLAAINATRTSSSSVDNNLIPVHKRQHMEASARRCEDLLQLLCLLHRSNANDRSLKPTAVTFDLVIKALTLINDVEGMKRVKQLREGTLS